MQQPIDQLNTGPDQQRQQIRDLKREKKAKQWRKH